MEQTKHDHCWHDVLGEDVCCWCGTQGQVSLTPARHGPHVLGADSLQRDVFKALILKNSGVILDALANSLQYLRSNR